MKSMNIYGNHYEKALKYGRQEHDQFFKSKIVNLDDKLPHLVHADYLEENGMPLTAQIIRKAAHTNNISQTGTSDTPSQIEDVSNKPRFWVHNQVAMGDKGKSSFMLVHSGIDKQGKANHLIYDTELPDKEVNNYMDAVKQELEENKHEH